MWCSVLEHFFLSPTQQSPFLWRSQYIIHTIHAIHNTYNTLSRIEQQKYPNKTKEHFGVSRHVKCSDRYRFVSGDIWVGVWIYMARCLEIYGSVSEDIMVVVWRYMGRCPEIYGSVSGDIWVVV